MAITISGENNNDRILASDGVIDQISGINIVGLITASHINVGSNIQLGNAGIITATTFVGNVTGNVNSTSPLLLQTGGSERFRITGNNELGIAGANYGSSGQVLTSQGSSSAPTWTTISGTTINNNADNRVITGSGSANTLNGESNVQIDSGGRLSVGNSQASTQYDGSNDLVIGNTTGDHGITIISNSNNRGRIMFSDTYSANTGRYAGQMLYDHQTETINWYSNYTNNAAVAMQLGGSENQLFVGIDKGSNTTFGNRSAYFHRATDNYISITGNGTVGIVFGDTIANNAGNYETYMHHTNSTNDFWIRVNQGSDNRYLKIRQSGNVEIGNGDLVMAAGHGIDFSAKTVSGDQGTASATVLDDFEEGDWTCTLSGNGGGSITASRASYTKIGNQVMCEATFVNPGNNSVSGNWSMTLPFQFIGGGSGSYGGGRVTYTRYVPALTGGFQSYTIFTYYGQGSCYLYKLGTNGSSESQWTGGSVNNSLLFSFSMTYTTGT